MTILDLQRRLAEVGRIRIGQQVPTSNGKTRPAKLATFRLTSADRTRIDQAAALYGGTVAQWQAPAGPQWEVITQSDALDVIVPPSDMAFSQHYELWSAGGCQRRCDGRNEAISQGPCLCDPEQRDCNIHTRLSVMLRDLPGLGVWRIDTSGYYAAVELQAAVEVVQLAAGRGQMLPARLRLEQRQVKRQVDGKAQTRNFPVPVLDIEISPGQLFSGSTATAGQIEDVPRPALTPVPASLPSGPATSVADQVAAHDQSPPPRRRSNAAAPIPPTSIEPRTVSQAAEHAPDGDEMSGAQGRMMQALFKERGVTERDEKLQWMSEVLGRQITTSKQLTKADASKVIDDLKAAPPGDGDPAGDPPLDPAEA